MTPKPTEAMYDAAVAAVGRNARLPRWLVTMAVDAAWEAQAVEEPEPVDKPRRGRPPKPKPDAEEVELARVPLGSLDVEGEE